MNLVGYYFRVTMAGREVSLPYSHGYPLTYLVRYGLDYRKPPTYFPFDDTDVVAYEPLYLTANVVIALISVVCIGVVIERRLRQPRFFQFSLKGLLIVMFLAAAIMASFQYWQPLSGGRFRYFVMPGMDACFFVPFYLGMACVLYVAAWGILFALRKVLGWKCPR